MPFSQGKVIGIDLGTANTIVCVKNGGILIREPSVVTYDSKSNKVIAIGNEAKSMIGKTPAAINAMRPLKDGVIADFEMTSEMLKQFFKKAAGNQFLSRPKVIICIPYGVTDVEKRAVENAALEAGAAAVALVDEPLAAAIGAGLPVRAPRGSMIVDIGGGTTEVAVISYGGIVVSNSLRTAGDELDEAVSAYIRRKFNVLIGENTAEDIKKTIGSAHPSTDIGMLEVNGRNLVTGLPAAFQIYSSEIREAFAEPLDAIIDVIKSTLEMTPPELCADLYDNGIMLAGGGALLSGLNFLVQDNTHLPVYLAKRPLDCVADGIVKVMNTPALESVLKDVHK